MDEEVLRYCNQKVITINKIYSQDADQVIISSEAFKMAQQRLITLCSFKLWTYFASYNDDTTFALSSRDVCAALSFTRNGYNSAIKELIDQGYLIQRNNKYQYDFYEYPVNINKN